MNSTPYIYIIEDEESISKLISLYLTKEEMKSKAFLNAENALSSIQNEKDNMPDLIILDLNLPGMSGFDFLEELTKRYKSDIPAVMILSARDSDEDNIKGLGYGADEFITKPFSPGVLVARVKAQNTDKQVYILDTHSVCTNMNKTNLDNLLETLEDIKNNNFSKQVKVSKDIAEDAVKSLDTMLELC